MPEQRIQVVFHVPNQVSEAGLCLLTRATCLFVKQSKEETDKCLELVKCIIYDTGGPL